MRRAMLSAMPATATPAGKHRVLLVTGLLGAGKSTALNVLEDLGWETIDNFPIRLLDRLINNPEASATDLRPPLAIGFDTRTRGFNPHKVIDRVKKLTARADLELTRCSSIARGLSWSGATTKPAARTRWLTACLPLLGLPPNANCWSRYGAGPTWSSPPPVFPPMTCSK